MQDDAGTRGYYTKIRKSVLYQSVKNISTMSGQFQSELPIFKTNRNTNRYLTFEKRRNKHGKERRKI